MKKLDGEMAKVLQEIIEEDDSQFEMDGYVYHLTLIDVPDLSENFDVAAILKAQEEKRKRKKEQALPVGIRFRGGFTSGGEE